MKINSPRLPTPFNANIIPPVLAPPPPPQSQALSSRPLIYTPPNTITFSVIKSKSTPFIPQQSNVPVYTTWFFPSAAHLLCCFYRQIGLLLVELSSIAQAVSPLPLKTGLPSKGTIFTYEVYRKGIRSEQIAKAPPGN